MVQLPPLIQYNVTQRGQHIPSDFKAIEEERFE